MIFKNNEDAMTSCKEWQKILRLQDWIVSTSIERGRDFNLEKSQGECSWNIQTKLAKIRVLDPSDYPPGSMIEQDMEQTLVHELLHLHYAPFDNFNYDSLENTALEQSIDSIAMALVNLKRGNYNWQQLIF